MTDAIYELTKEPVFMQVVCFVVIIGVILWIIGWINYFKKEKKKSLYTN